MYIYDTFYKNPSLGNFKQSLQIEIIIPIVTPELLLNTSFEMSLLHRKMHSDVIVRPEHRPTETRSMMTL